MQNSGKYLIVGLIMLVVGLVAGWALTSAGGGSPVGEAETAEDVAKVEEVWDEYSNSLNDGDFERWIALWIEDGLQMPPDEPRHVGMEQIVAANKPGFELFDFEEFAINPVGIQILGDRAYSHGTYGFSMTPKEGGDTLDITGKFLTILEKQDDGNWKLAIDIYNYSPQE